MTPRALLTTIGGTAIAFAVAIVAAAGMAPLAATSQTATSVIAAPAVETRQLAYTTNDIAFMASWDEPCRIAL